MRLYILSSLLIALLLGNNQYVFSQFALIQDKDGFVNVRKEASATNAPVDTLTSGSIVWTVEPEGNWTVVFYSRTDGVESLMGYIHTSRLLPVEKFVAIPEKKMDADAAVFYHDSLKVTVSTTIFTPSQYKLNYMRNGQYAILTKINNKYIWGTDGGMPKRRYKGISVEWNGRKTEVPAKALEDLFEPTLHNTKVSYDKETDRLYISAENSDGAGSYVAMWIFERGVYQRRVVLNPQ